MSTSTIVKLATGQAITLLVESAQEVEGQYGKQVRFDGQTAENENVTLFLPLESATRQLERSGITVASAVGEVLKIEKVEKNSRTFINISRAAGQPTNGRGKAVTPPQRTDAPDDTLPWEREAVDKITAHYQKCFQRATELAKGSGITPTLEGVSAIAATIFLATKSSV